MTLDYTVPGQLTVDMRSYIKAMVKEIPAKMRGSLATPAATFLFDTREGAPKLGKEDKERYHSLSAKLLYLSQFGRPDIQTAVAFLSTRTQKPDEDDDKKLGKLMKYLQTKPDITLKIRQNLN